MLRQSHAILLLCLLAGSSHAGVVTLTPTDVGSYGRTSFFTGSYDVAALDGLPELDFRNYAIFDLSGINGTIVEAQLVTDTGADVARFNNVTISLQSYSDSISALSDGTANFASLGSGTEYASFTVLASAPAQSPLAIDLNQNAIDDLNASTNLFAIAGSQPDPTFTSGLFSGVTESRVSLVLTTTAVPEPSSTVLFLVLGSTCLLRRRRKGRWCHSSSPTCYGHF